MMEGNIPCGLKDGATEGEDGKERSERQEEVMEWCYIRGIR